MSAHVLAISFLGNMDTLVVATVILVLFGVKKLPTFVPNLRRQMDEFKKAYEEFKRR